MTALKLVCDVENAVLFGADIDWNGMRQWRNTRFTSACTATGTGRKEAEKIVEQRVDKYLAVGYQLCQYKQAIWQLIFTVPTVT